MYGKINLKILDFSYVCELITFHYISYGVIPFTLNCERIGNSRKTSLANVKFLKDFDNTTLSLPWPSLVCIHIITKLTPFRFNIVPFRIILVHFMEGANQGIQNLFDELARALKSEVRRAKGTCSHRLVLGEEFSIGLLCLL